MHNGVSLLNNLLIWQKNDCFRILLKRSVDCHLFKPIFQLKLTFQTQDSCIDIIALKYQRIVVCVPRALF